MRTRPTSGSRDADLVDVELVETDDVAPVPVSPEDAERAAVARRRRRRLWAVTAAGACVAVIAFAVLGNVVEARQESARLAILAESPGLVPRLDHPLTPAWTVEDGWVSGQSGDLVLVGSMAGNRTRAVDAETGEVRWTYEPPSLLGASAAWCGVLVEREDDGFPVRAVEGGGPQPVVCIHTTYNGEPGANAYGTSTVEIINRTDGQVLHSSTESGILAVLPRQGDLVAVSGTSDGFLEVHRRTTGTWALTWSYRSAEPLLGGELSALDDYWISGGVLHVEAEGALAVSLDTGREVEVTADEGARTVTTSLPDGARAVWRDGTTGDGSGQVVNADGSVRFELPGPVQPLLASDGTDRDVLLVRNNGLAVLDVATGRQLWADTDRDAVPVTQVDGVLVVSGRETVRAVHVRDGRTVWEVPTDEMDAINGMSDGVVVLATTPQDGRRYLGAFSLVDGSEQWRVPLPLEIASVQVTEEGLVIFVTANAVTAMR